MKVNFEFKKVQWFYEVYLNGNQICTVTKEGLKWTAKSNNTSKLYKGKTRYEASENYFKDNYSDEYDKLEMIEVKKLLEANSKIINKF